MAPNDDKVKANTNEELGSKHSNGELGPENLNGGLGSKHLNGGLGSEHLNEGFGSEHLHGGLGSEHMNGGLGSEHLNGGLGSDHLNEELRSKPLNGGLGSEHLNGGLGSEHLNGGLGSEHLNRGLGSEHLNGGLGSEPLNGGLGSEHLNIGSGTEHLDGRLGSDHLNGGSESEHFDGGSKSENLDGGLRSEHLNGGLRSKHLNGGLGSEHLNGGLGSEHLKGGLRSELLNGRLGSEHLNGRLGSEYLNGGLVSEHLNEGLGSELLNGGLGFEHLNGGLGSEHSNGGLRSENLNGGLESEHLNGGLGSEHLNGGLGSEHLNGGLGYEHLNGGSGSEHLNEGLKSEHRNRGVRSEHMKRGLKSEHVNGGLGSEPLNAGAFRVYPTNRDIILKSAQSWLAGKRVDDNIGNYWRVHDKLYDLTDFVDKHPGGREWIELHQGTDVTEAFETSHIGLTAEQILKKYFIKNADTPRNSPYTFHENGFYKTLKKKARPVLKSVGTGPTRQMLLMQDLTALSFVCLCLTAARYDSLMLVLLAGLNLTWTVVIAHNFTHQRDSIRMYYFDLCLMSSSDWRVTHAISHHLFTNSIYDWEVAGFEPFINFMPDTKKNIYVTYLSLIYCHILHALGMLNDAWIRIAMLCMGHKKLRPENLLPFIVLLLMCSLSSSIAMGVKLWLTMQCVASFFFLYGPQTGIHHHPDIWHHGDAERTDPDWGLCQLDAVRDKADVSENLFIVSTTFGDHTLHHMFPTVDHSKLPLLYPVFLETCKEFGIPFAFHKNMFWGFYKQMLNRSPKIEDPPVYKSKKID